MTWKGSSKGFPCFRFSFPFVPQFARRCPFFSQEAARIMQKTRAVISKPLAFNVAPQMHGARRTSDRTGECGGKRALAGPGQAADGNQIEPVRSEKAASGFQMTARLHRMIVAASWLENGHLCANGRAQGKEERKQGKALELPFHVIADP